MIEYRMYMYDAVFEIERHQAEIRADMFLDKKTVETVKRGKVTHFEKKQLAELGIKRTKPNIVIIKIEDK